MLRASKAPAMIIVGESDPIFSARRTLERARRLMPNLEATESMAGHGHGLEVSGPVMELAATFIGAGP
jgi:pimeloyl-ACP methyl ester carboxylesterase